MAKDTTAEGSAPMADRETNTAVYRSEADRRYSSIFDQIVERLDGPGKQLLTDLDAAVGERLCEAEQYGRGTVPGFDLGDIGHRFTNIELALCDVARAISRATAAKVYDWIYFTCAEDGCNYRAPDHREMVAHRLSHRRVEEEAAG